MTEHLSGLAFFRYEDLIVEPWTGIRAIATQALQPEVLQALADLTPALVVLDAVDRFPEQLRVGLAPMLQRSRRVIATADRMATPLQDQWIGSFDEIAIGDVDRAEVDVQREPFLLVPDEIHLTQRLIDVLSPMGTRDSPMNGLLRAAQSSRAALRGAVSSKLWSRESPGTIKALRDAPSEDPVGSAFADEQPVQGATADAEDLLDALDDLGDDPKLLAADAAIAREMQQAPVLCVTAFKRTAEYVGERLRERDPVLPVLHGGLPAHDRMRALDALEADGGIGPRVIVATDAAVQELVQVSDRWTQVWIDTPPTMAAAVRRLRFSPVSRKRRVVALAAEPGFSPADDWLLDRLAQGDLRQGR